MAFAPARFSTGHLHALAALLIHKGRNPAWTTHFGDIGAARDRGVALLAWLYHLLGGEASGLGAPVSWQSSKSGKRLLTRVEKSAAAAAKKCAQTAAQLRKLRSPGAEPRARAQLGWRMVQEAAVTELTVLDAGWFAPPVAKQPQKVSAPVAPASVSPEGRVWKLTEELRAERAHSDEMRIELETSQRELKRALRREECGAAAVVAEGAWAELQIKMMAQRHKVRHPINENRAPPPSAHCSPTPQPTSATQKEKPKLRAAAQDTARSRNQAATEFVKVCAAYLRQEREMRPQPQRGAAGGGGKRSAEVDAAAAARRVGDLETALKRVRGSQQHTLLNTRE